MNDGSGKFTDQTFSRLRSLPGKEAPVARTSWSDNFQFIDVNRDGHVDLIGSHSDVVRLWVNNGSGSFSEVPVETGTVFADGATPLGWADFGSGRIGTLAYRTSWTDAAGSATRVWFTHYELEGSLP